MRKNQFKVEFNGTAIVDVNGEDLGSMQGGLEISRVDGLELSDSDSDTILSRLGETLAELGDRDHEELSDEDLELADLFENDFDQYLDKAFGPLVVEADADEQIEEIIESQQLDQRQDAVNSIAKLEAPLSGNAHKIMSSMEVIAKYLENLDNSMHLSVPEEIAIAMADIVMTCFELEGK